MSYNNLHTAEAALKAAQTCADTLKGATIIAMGSAMHMHGDDEKLADDCVERLQAASEECYLPLLKNLQDQVDRLTEQGGF